MTFPAFLSSLIIASSATATLLFGILTYVHKNYKERSLEAIIFLSFICTVSTNAFILIGFYEVSDLEVCLTYPIVSYLLAMLLLTLAALYIFFIRIANLE
jgi:hypothetical protein